MSTVKPDSNELFIEIAKSTELSFRPWKYSVVDVSGFSSSTELDTDNIDFILHIECRDKTGHRHPDRDLELEIFKSGIDVNITLSWIHQEDYPILWQGNHSVWMDGLTGKLCKTPDNGSSLESLARRVRTLLANNSD